MIESADMLDNNPNTLSLQIPSRDVALDAEGQHFTTQVSGSIEVGISNNRLVVDAHVRSNLHGLQNVVPAIVQAKANKHDECGDVVNVHTVSLRYGGGASAEAFAAAHYEKWNCTIFKTKLFEQNGSVTMGLDPAVSADGKTIGLNPSVRKIEADGFLGGLLGNSVFGEALQKLIVAKIMESIDPSKFQQSFPPDLLAFHPQINSARFVDLGENKLGLDAVLHVEVPEEAAQQMLAKFLAMK